VPQKRLTRGALVYGFGSLSGLAMTLAMALSVGEVDEVLGLYLVLFNVALLMTVLGFVTPRVRPWLSLMGVLPVSLFSFALLMGVFPTPQLLSVLVLFFGLGFSFSDDLTPAAPL
jgi:hypothetical protein